MLWSPDGHILLLSDAPPGSKSTGQAYIVSALLPVEPHVQEVRMVTQLVTLLGITHTM